MWQKESLDPVRLKALAERFGLDMLTASILMRRSVTAPEDLLFFLEKDLLLTHNPYLFSHIDVAVDRVRAAAEEKEKVLVFGDKDVDGITATIIMMSALKHIGIQPEYRVPMGDDLYGLSKDVIDEFAEKDGTLIITVDTGISSFDEIKHAASKGVDCLVFDHHVLQDGTLPAAVAVVNPKDPSSGYPFEGLAGCGVAFKFFQALCMSLTDLYNQPICFLHIEQIDENREDQWQLEAARTGNLIVTDSLQFTIDGSMTSQQMQQFISLSAGCALFAWDSTRMTSLFEKITGGRVQFELQELKSRLAEGNVAFQDKTLKQLSYVSRINRYSEKKTDYMPLLLNLFRNFYFRRYQNELAPCFNQLDLMALGTLADLMPLKNENRILVQQGMQILSKVERPALRELLLKLQLLGTPLGTHEVSWQITPVLNSSGRMGCPDKAVKLFLTEDNELRKQLVDEIYTLNQERKQLGDNLWEELREEARQSLEHLGNRMIALCNAKIPLGITGILASRFVSVFKVPVMILSERADCISGSIRSPRTISVQNFLDASSHFFDDFGGHDCAAGFSMQHNQLKPFMSSLQLSSRDKFTVNKETDNLVIDAELPLSWLKPDLETLFDKLEPYGQTFPSLVFLCRRLKVTDASLVGRSDVKHARLIFEADKVKWTAFFWKEGERVSNEISIGDSLDIVFNLSRNTYMGQTSLQLHLLDYKKSD